MSVLFAIAAAMVGVRRTSARAVRPSVLRGVGRDPHPLASVVALLAISRSRPGWFARCETDVVAGEPSTRTTESTTTWAAPVGRSGTGQQSVPGFAPTPMPPSPPPLPPALTYAQVAGALLTSGALLPERGSRRVVVLAGLLDAAATLFFVLSTRSGLLSVGAVLASLFPAATIVLSRFVSHELTTRRQLVGIVLAGAAVSLLAL